VVTAATVAVKLPLELPAGMDTDAGRLTLAFPLVKLTVTPDEPAALDKFTVQLADPGAFTDVGEHVTADGCTTGV